MSDIPKVVSDYLADIGRKGGSSTSEKKRNAVRRNLEAGRARRWPGKIPCQLAPMDLLIGERKADADATQI